MNTFSRSSTIIAAILVSSLFQGCGNPDDAARGEDSSTAVRIFPVRGVVQKPMDDPSIMLIDHEEIPGFMPRMIMPFRVLDPVEFEGLAPGMVVTLNYHVSESESWATDVEATGQTGPITYQGDRGSTPTLGVGDPLPDHELIDENGSRVRLGDFRGMAVAITFVFSRCPVPEYCPRMMSHFAAVRAELEKNPAMIGSYRLLTISFDTKHDNPGNMKVWASSFGYVPGGAWHLLTTPDRSVIDALAAQTGLRFGDSGGTLQHNLRTLVLDRDGVIRAIHTDENWKVENLVSEIVKASR